MRLSEIEARLREGWLVQGRDAVGGPTVYQDRAQTEADASLLIRAVRELGATVREYMDICGDTVTLPYQVSPDVLELLEGLGDA